MLTPKNVGYIAVIALLIGAYVLAKQQGWIGTSSSTSTATA